MTPKISTTPKNLGGFTEFCRENSSLVIGSVALTALVTVGLTFGARYLWNSLVQDRTVKALSSDILSKGVVSTEVMDQLKDAFTQKNLVAFAGVLKNLEQTGFFQEKSQERAKAALDQVMREVFNLTIAFPKTGEVESLEIPEGFLLNAEVFSFCNTEGVQHDIPRCSRDSRRQHLFQVASKFNLTEAAEVTTTVGIGEAMNTSAHDRSQGPLAQRTNPFIFETINAFGAHLGFNMLNEVLPPAMGSTAYLDETSIIKGGWLVPQKEGDNGIEAVSQSVVNNYPRTEYACYESIPANGHKSIHLMLQAAPAGAVFDRKVKFSSRTLNENLARDHLQKMTSLSNNLALFRQGIDLAEKDRSKHVVLHVTGVGLGDFGNEGKNWSEGLAIAANTCQQKMAELGIKVQVDVYGDFKTLREGGTGIPEAIEGGSFDVSSPLSAMKYVEPQNRLQSPQLT